MLITTKVINSQSDFDSPFPIMKSEGAQNENC
jgi:hypothetical protein